MKIVPIVWIVISVFLIIISGLGILDCSVSLKYEIEPFDMSPNLNEFVADERDLLNRIIMILWYAVIFLTINIAIMVRWIFMNKNQYKTGNESNL
ncbi:hypothetical protein ACFP1I_09655 [Dyadobacter subterraneus]|uniref:Uncharacterized protein n=1 Tax=Dyadobacter subterraneus TaxID=2773304 RepID=A0ABR9WB48_9BACT|nr:hypothetical protein [Dyadobacter subterraneus]MBE9462633.1 hypothetical protein [Dyadobacter subterraneus]